MKWLLATARATANVCLVVLVAVTIVVELAAIVIAWKESPGFLYLHLWFTGPLIAITFVCLVSQPSLVGRVVAGVGGMIVALGSLGTLYFLLDQYIKLADPQYMNCGPPVIIALPIIQWLALGVIAIIVGRLNDISMASLSIVEAEE